MSSLTTASAAELAGRIAVVTGGGSGMGRQLCVQLASHGCHVRFRDANSGGPGGRPAPLAARFHRVATRFPLNLYGI